MHWYTGAIKKCIFNSQSTSKETNHPIVLICPVLNAIFLFAVFGCIFPDEMMKEVQICKTGDRCLTSKGNTNSAVLN